MTILNGAFASVEDQRAGAETLAPRAPLSSFRRQVIAIELLVVFATAFLTPVLVRDANEVGTTTFPLVASLSLAVLWLLILFAAKAYNPLYIDGIAGIKRIFVGSLVTLGSVAASAYVVGAAPYRPYVLWEFGVGLPLLLLARSGSVAWLRTQRSVGEARVDVLLVAGAHASAPMALELGRDTRYNLLGTINPEHFAKAALAMEIAERAVREQVDAVLVGGAPNIHPDTVRELTWALEDQDIDVLVATGITSFAQGRSNIRTVGDELVIEIDHSHQALGPRIVKRAFDIVAALALLILVSPLILVVAIAIPLESRGPAFFVQPRVGKNGKLFPFIKLRSMRQDAHLERADVLGPTDDGILDRYLNDDRITKVGSFIRRWSIDELPQLVNVLMGQMSLVGPRPVLEDELHDLPEHGERVHLAKPGLTGLWQISGRKEIRWEDRIDMDLDYVDTWSLSLDAKIIAHTAGAIFKGSGAY